MAFFLYGGKKRQFTQEILESGKAGRNVCQLEQVLLAGCGVGIPFPEEIAKPVSQNDVDELRRAGTNDAVEHAEGSLKLAEGHNRSFGGASLEIQANNRRMVVGKAGDVTPDLLPFGPREKVWRLVMLRLAR